MHAPMHATLIEAGFEDLRRKIWPNAVAGDPQLDTYRRLFAVGAAGLVDRLADTFEIAADDPRRQQLREEIEAFARVAGARRMPP